MNLVHDLLLADSSDFDNILADLENTIPVNSVQRSCVSIDDAVTIVAAVRQALDDRSAWWKVRREVYASFASHEQVTTRSLGRLPDELRDEIAELDATRHEELAGEWIARDDASPVDEQQATEALEQFASVCELGRDRGKSVFIRTCEPFNTFEAAFSGLEGRALKKFRRAFDSWDSIKRHEAHERYKYYQNEGKSDAKCLALVLKDYSRAKISKLNLKADQRKVLRHLKQRVKNYSKSPNAGPGEPADAITLITLAFSLEQAGWVVFVLDTRPHAEPDGEWNNYIEENSLEFDQWCDAIDSLCEDGLPIKVTRPDGSSEEIVDRDSGTEALAGKIGLMLRDALLAVRQEASFRRLPLAPKCIMYIDEHNGHFGWPDIEQLQVEGRV